MDPLHHAPLSVVENDRPLTPPITAPITDDERVDHASWASFPASDPPPWTTGREWSPPPDSDDPDEENDRDRARRRRHVDA
jgi:hypothetical protein